MIRRCLDTLYCVMPSSSAISFTLRSFAIILIIGQLGKLLGLSIDAADPAPQLAEALREIGSANLATVVVGLIMAIIQAATGMAIYSRRPY